MGVRISAMRWVPAFAQGYVKDLRVRWALEEAGIPYEADLTDAQSRATEAYRDWQPFGQVPAYKDADVDVFESGAIVLYIAAKSDALAPRDEAGRARVMAWVLAALNTIEPLAQNIIELDDNHAGEGWALERRARLETNLSGRLAALSVRLGDKDYLEGRFTAGDLIMTTVLRELVDGGILGKFPALNAHRERCEARPAFAKALEAQLQAFRDNAPAGS